MNRARRERFKKLVEQGLKPRVAYEVVRSSIDLAHAIWIGGALIRKQKEEQ